MSFKNKYIKYKQKYLNLKHKIGGAASVDYNEHIPSNTLFIPCEINNFTENLYISSDVYRNVNFKNFIKLFNSLLIITKHKPSNYYMQDPYILLKDESNKDYAIEVRPDYIFEDTFETNFNIIKCNTPETTNHFGGNFISAPNNQIFTIDNSYLTSTCKINLNLPPIILECGFQTGKSNNKERGRHIDEIMCFMPYGLNEYKVWIYKFGTITLNNLYTPPNKDNVLAKFTQLKEKYLKIPYKKTIKTTKRIEGSFNRREVFEEQINPYKNENDTLKTDAELLNIDTIKKSFNSIEYYILSKIINNPSIDIDIQIPTVTDIMAKFEEERVANLDKLSQALFNGPYNNHIDKFVEFPINLNCNVILDSYKNYDGTPESVILLDWKFTNIPIFNRLLVETNELRECIFSSPLTQDVNEILIQEQPNIKSYLNDKPFTFSDINTLKYNDQGIVGGNMHCLIKNKY